MPSKSLEEKELADNWESMQLGKQIKTSLKWDQIKWSFMLEILRAKLEANRDYRDHLLSTGTSIIIEDTANNYWGIGADKKGRNMLGVLHTFIRGECFYELIPTHSNL